MKTKMFSFLIIVVGMCVSNGQAQEFTLTTTAANTVSSKASIDMPGLTGNPLAIIVATPIGNTEALNPHPIGAWYYSGKWNIFNTNHAVMPLGAKYKVEFFREPGPNQFLHIVTQQNLGSEGSYIDNPALNNNPGAVFKILQNHSPDVRTPYNLNRFKASAAYSSAAGRWYIANVGGELLGRGSAYNIVVASGGSVGVVTPTQTTGPPAGTPAGNAPGPVGPITGPVATNTGPARTNTGPVSTNTNTGVIKPGAKDPTAILPNPTPAPIATPSPLSGFVDLHTHPMSHLGFGKKLLHGAPDTGLLVPKGTHNCNTSDFRASTMAEALGNCSSTHGGWGPGNGCGDHIRAFVLNNLFDKHFAHKLPANLLHGGNLIGDHQHDGIETHPNFLYWPSQTSKVHQQMWWEWIKRAKEKGNLRVMVALTVNSELLAKILNGDEPRDDKNSADLQLDELKTFIGSHPDFMEIAYTAGDLRRIVGEGKLAVVLGMEVDNIGNFNQPGAAVNEGTVRAEIQRLYAKGVRYVFPIHLVDNKFGGTAVYEDLFNFSNKYSTGSFYSVNPSELVRFKLGDMSQIGQSLSASKGIGTILDALSPIPYQPAFQPDPTKPKFCINPLPLQGSLGCWETFLVAKGILSPGPSYQTYNTSPIWKGHVNSQGLTNIGEFATKEMMKLGMLIDIDHMSDLSQNDTLKLAEQFSYPVNIGHNGIRKTSGSERHAAIASIKRVAKLGGVFGIGTADSDSHIADAQTFISSFEAVWSVMAEDGGIPRVGIGTDVNGMERLPRASTGLNSASFYSANFFDDIPNNIEENFQMAKTGTRSWDYTTEGVVHYGLMADFMRDVRKRNVLVHQRMMDSAEYFAQMWEKVEKQKTSVK